MTEAPMGANILSPTLQHAKGPAVSGAVASQLHHQEMGLNSSQPLFLSNIGNLDLNVRQSNKHRSQLDSMPGDGLVNRANKHRSSSQNQTVISNSHTQVPKQQASSSRRFKSNPQTNLITHEDSNDEKMRLLHRHVEAM
jgi:hypothetical protein